MKAQVTPRHGSNHDESDEEYHSANERDDRNQDPRGKILSAAELELILVENAPELSGIYALH